MTALIAYLMFDERLTLLALTGMALAVVALLARDSGTPRPTSLVLGLLRPALECLQHVVDTEHLLQSRVKAFLAGQNFPAFNPDEQGSKPSGATSPASLAYEFSNLRDESLAMIARFTSTDLGRQVNHQELGPVTLHQMLNEWAGHDLVHLMQAEKAMLQPFIHDCGPWIAYFKEHLVQAK